MRLPFFNYFWDIAINAFSIYFIGFMLGIGTIIILYFFYENDKVGKQTTL